MMSKQEYQKKYYEQNQDRLRAASKEHYINSNRKDIERQRRRDDLVGTMVKAAKRRAKLKGLEFDLDKDQITIPEFCPVFGIKLAPGQGSPPADSSPSLDRKDNSRGYTMDNIEVISWRANKLKNDMTPKELQMLTRYFAGIKGLDNNDDEQD